VDRSPGSAAARAVERHGAARAGTCIDRCDAKAGAIYSETDAERITRRDADFERQRASFECARRYSRFAASRLAYLTDD